MYPLLFVTMLGVAFLWATVDIAPRHAVDHAARRAEAVGEGLLAWQAAARRTVENDASLDPAGIGPGGVRLAATEIARRADRPAGAAATGWRSWIGPGPDHPLLTYVLSPPAAGTDLDFDAVLQHAARQTGASVVVGRWLNYDSDVCGAAAGAPAGCILPVNDTVTLRADPGLSGSPLGPSDPQGFATDPDWVAGRWIAVPSPVIIRDAPGLANDTPVIAQFLTPPWR